MKARILVTDDDTVSAQLFADVLEDEGYSVDQAHTGEEAIERLRHEPYDLLITDVRLPGVSGLDVTKTVRRTYPEVPIVVMTAFGSIETAIAAIQEGAFDYTSKPMNLEEFKQTVTRALAQRRLHSSHELSDEGGEEPVGSIIGQSAAMVEVYKTVARVAPTRSTVLILGESGTGKELIARAIHQHSPRARRPFVAVDCGALSETLLESELFGHVRGAFTGAVTDKIGVFEEANSGTCFLDEIGDIGQTMQAKLLRVLQEGEVRRVGGQKWTRVDIRVVAATNKNLGEFVRKGTFREDLYYRLRVVTIQLPPLRERPDDIPALAQYFLRRYSRDNGKTVTGIDDKAMATLCGYTWPGNIRELENTVERAVALAGRPVIAVEDLPAELHEANEEQVSDGLAQKPPSLFVDKPTLEELKKRYIRYILGHTQGNLSRAAEILDVDRRSLYRMLKRYQIPSPREEA